MSNVDFRNLDGASQVSEKRAGSATRFALPIMGALAASGLLWMNWPSAKETSALNKEDEVFETSQMSVKNLPDEKPDREKRQSHRRASARSTGAIAGRRCQQRRAAGHRS